jgi:hypothetical protein
MDIKRKTISEPGAAMKVEVFEIPPEIQLQISRGLKYGVKSVDPNYPSKPLEKFKEWLREKLKI